MNLSNFVAYVKQAWKNKPDTSTPLSAERLTHQEEGIKGNSDAIQELAAAVVSQIVNNPDKIASMAALYAVNQKVTTLDGKVGDTAQLPSGTADVASAIAQLYSNKQDKLTIPLYMVDGNVLDWNSVNAPGIYSGLNAKNAPADSNAGWINAIAIPTNGQSTFLDVIAFDGGSNRLWLRHMNNGTWFTWVSH